MNYPVVIAGLSRLGQGRASSNLCELGVAHGEGRILIGCVACRLGRMRSSWSHHGLSHFDILTWNNP